MILTPNRIRVFPNPWGVNPAGLRDAKALAARAAKKIPPVDSSTLDHVGRPCGVLHCDPFGDGGRAGRLVGARVCETHTTVGKTPERMLAVVAGDFWRPRQRTVYTFLGCSAHETRAFQLADELAKREPVTLPPTAYYLAAICDGSLIPADARSAIAAGMKSEDFEPVDKLFPKLARAAAAVFDAQYGGIAAYQTFVEERAEEAAAAKKASATAESGEDPRAGETTNDEENS